MGSDEPTELDFAEYVPDIRGVPMEYVVETLLDGGYSNDVEYLIVHYVIQSGYRFSTESHYARLRKVLAPRNNFTLAHEFALCGYVFDSTDLAVLSDVGPSGGFTLEKTMTAVKSVREQRLVSDAPSNQFQLQLAWKDGIPFFEKKDDSKHEMSQRVNIEFGGWVCSGSYFYVDQSFDLRLTQENGGWQVRIEDNPSCSAPSKRSYLFRKALVTELAKAIQSAILLQHDFDFSDYEKRLSYYCFIDTQVQISIFS